MSMAFRLKNYFEAEKKMIKIKIKIAKHRKYYELIACKNISFT